jgi:hypothetical protein
MKPSVKGLLRLGAGGVMLTVPIMASALKFESGEILGSFDTTLSAGVQIRMQDQDKSLYGIANGGTGRSVNDDDGNLNYDKGDVTSAPIKATHDLEVKYRNYGIFNRVSYFYDIENHDSNKLGRRGEDRLGAEFDLLDLFAYGSFNVAGRRVDARAGRQVVNWGESTFIPNSINSINPVDVSKLRQPGSEIKEALLPTSMLWSSLQITDTLSAELLWLMTWDRTEIDPRGSFFSNNDVLSDDSDKVFAGFGRRADDRSPPLAPVTPPATPNPTAQLWGDRISDRRPDDKRGQYGAALRHYAEWLKNTELGLYYLRYHSRTPFASGLRAGPQGPGPGGLPNPLALSAYAIGQPAGTVAQGSAFYFAEYPEDIDLYGISFNTDGPFGIALQGEYSWRPNQPVQLEDVEVVLAVLGLPNNITGMGAGAVPQGTKIQGYRRVDMHQAQMTATKAFGPMFKAQQFTLLGEVGYTFLELPKGVLFNGPGTNLPSMAAASALSAGSTQQGQGYADRSSWGYRLVSRLDYENLIGAVGVSPRLVFAHDVNGVGPTFNQETKALTLGLGFNYLQRWQADLAYTSFFGGRTYSGTDPTATPGQPASYASSANPLKDRDFLAVSVSYAF